MFKKAFLLFFSVASFLVCAADEPVVEPGLSSSDVPAVDTSKQTDYLVSGESMVGVAGAEGLFFPYFSADVFDKANTIVSVSYADLSWVKVGYQRADFGLKDNVFFRAISAALKQKKSVNIGFLATHNRLESFVVQIIFKGNDAPSVAVYSLAPACPEWMASVVALGLHFKSSNAWEIHIPSFSGLAKIAVALGGAVFVKRNWQVVRHPVVSFQSWQQKREDQKKEDARLERVAAKKARIQQARQAAAEQRKAADDAQANRLYEKFNTEKTSDDAVFAAEDAVTLTPDQEAKMKSLLLKRSRREQREGKIINPNIFKALASYKDEEIIKLNSLHQYFYSIAPKHAGDDGAFSPEQTLAKEVLTKAFKLVAENFIKEMIEGFIAAIKALDQDQLRLTTVGFQEKILELKKLYEQICRDSFPEEEEE
ncbi:hypothetical protein FJ366_04250 [Candidatus Dependentiae bacterium]|nr:hypothetical protein [Candidatus Dependentiae bacterium]